MRRSRLSCMLLLLLLAGLCWLAGSFDCNFQDQCPWHWQEDILLLTPGTDPQSPPTDAEGNPSGRYLYYRPHKGGRDARTEIISPWFTFSTERTCLLEAWLNMDKMDNNYLKVLVRTSNLTWEIAHIPGNSHQKWQRYRHPIGQVTQPFRVVLEVVTAGITSYSHVAIDNIRVLQCTEGGAPSSVCEQHHFRCSNDACITRDRVCDMTEDCENGEDEEQDCDEIPAHARCNFEEGMCSWVSSNSGGMRWELQEASKWPKGPPFDHTYQNASNPGTFLVSNFNRAKVGEVLTFTSPDFPPPPLYHSSPMSPYFNSCQVRFFYYKPGKRGGDLQLRCSEFLPNKRQKEFIEMWRDSSFKSEWRKAVVPLPCLHRYALQFSAARGMRLADVTIDDVTLSPECFGLGVPENVSRALPTHEPDMTLGSSPPSQTTRLKTFKLTTCGSRGRDGPEKDQCSKEYTASSVEVTVFNGIQRWKVPDSGIYTLFVRGAGGGNGLRNRGVSRGAVIRASFNWTAGDVIYFLIGQHGHDACAEDTPPMFKYLCEQESASFRGRRGLGNLFPNKFRSVTGGGGGGGATYIFQLERDGSTKIPLVVAAGGGGLSVNRDDNPNTAVDPGGRGLAVNLPPDNGASSPSGPGGGGGWNSSTRLPSSGSSLVEGGRGGRVCQKAEEWATDGGFGGGGGGCSGGGGGGGYRGGESAITDSPTINGRGGMSYLASSAMLALVEPGMNSDDGEVEIVPPQQGCGCQYQCILLDINSQAFHCICPAGHVLESDGLHCKGEPIPTSHFPARHLVLVALCVLVSVAVVLFFCLLAVNKYRKKQARDLSHEPLNDPELQLSRLRQATGGMVTEYNPNYEFGGTTCTVQDLRAIPRENLTLIKALGQGAFGEVYQGYLTTGSDNSGEMPVAVKTLPELSSNQAEMDFLMEALIMSKFTHPNIVGFIGICFEKLPRFIVLELLPGGDLKSFLRESRPKPHKPSPLTLTDLLTLALDVAKGCQYLEDNHFIHRDIAARNCLLTTKDVNRVVKIADFGMARDIYRADYYRKGGKAMLPVKWMPPEAFLDGIFTSKTDVWSFGVLLWEVMSLGYMPYPGRGNQEVMQLVTSGGRLEPPTNCPSPVYHIMMQCWHPIPDERPNFITIIERVGYCLQDPEVTSAPLPVFHRPPSMERDATVMRPADSENSCLQLLSPGSEDYLIPMPPSTYSLATDKTDLQSSPSLGSAEQLLELEDKGGGPPPVQSPATWETKFTNPMDAPVPTLSGGETTVQQPGRRRTGGYTQVPTQEEAGGRGARATKQPASRVPSGRSLDSLPVAPEAAAPANANDGLQSNLSLDAAALSQQAAKNPVRYVNVDVNCNSGDGLPLTRTNSYEQNVVNQNLCLDGYAGVNPVA